MGYTLVAETTCWNVGGGAAPQNLPWIRHCTTASTTRYLIRCTQAANARFRFFRRYNIIIQKCQYCDVNDVHTYQQCSRYFSMQAEKVFGKPSVDSRTTIIILPQVGRLKRTRTSRHLNRKRDRLRTTFYGVRNTQMRLWRLDGKFSLPAFGPTQRRRGYEWSTANNMSCVWTTWTGVWAHPPLYLWHATRTTAAVVIMFITNADINMTAVNA